MRGGRLFPAALAAMLLAAPAEAGVIARGPDGFTIVHQGWSARQPQAQWEALADWGGWWPDAHTISGSAANIDLDLEANGELEEEWDGNEVLHATVLETRPNARLRLSGGFGPLRTLPVTGILDIALAPERDGTRVTLTYRVGGPASADLGRLAGALDAMFAEAFLRLLAHTARPAPADAKED